MKYQYLTSDAIVYLTDELKLKIPNGLEEDRWSELPSQFAKASGDAHHNIVRNVINMGSSSCGLEKIVHTSCAKMVEFAKVKAARSTYDVFGIEPNLSNNVVAGCLDSIARTLVDIYFDFDEAKRDEIRTCIREGKRPTWMPVSVSSKIEVLRTMADEKMFINEYNNDFWTYLIIEVDDRVKTTRSHRLDKEGKKLKSPHTIAARKAFDENS